MDNENINNSPEQIVDETVPVPEESTQQESEITIETPPVPVAEIHSEPAAEPIVETTAEPIAEPIAETTAEPVAEPTVETIAEPVTETVSEVVSQDAAPSEPAPAPAPVAKEEQPKKIDKYAPVFEELAVKKANNEKIEVFIKDRIRGGLRVIYKDAPLFLPASHFSMRRTPSEQELLDSVGSTIFVEIHEIQEYDEGRKAVIVTRKNLLVDDFWSKLSIGDIVEGKVSSIASFGVFIDIGGIEGLIHISRLSQVHVDDPSKFVKKGDLIRAVVVELDKERNRIALSRKELEESPWTHIDEEFPIDSVCKGVVRRITDFGAYVELKPGVDGLLRTPEISWTKRIKTPNEVFKPGEEIEVKILTINSDKRTISLSYKATTPNPWPALVDKYPVGSEFEGTVFQVMPQGMIVTIGENLDGFMPRSKMKKVLQGNKIPYQAGEKINVFIADIIPNEESLILAPKVEEEHETSRPSNPKPPRQESNQAKTPQAGGISPLDMLSESEKKNLLDSM